MKYISFGAPWLFSATFFVATMGNAILHFDASFLDHKSSSMTHPLSEWEKGILHHPSSCVGNVQWANSTQVACWSSFNMYGIYFAKTYSSPAVSER
jgi:hypothetical protein